MQDPQPGVSDSDAIQYPEGRRTDEKKSGYKVGDRVDKAGKCVCEICHTEGGVHEHEFVEGEEFPLCMNCGKATSWKKAEE